MSYSKLVNYVKISPNSSNPRKHETYNPSGKITDIVIHHAAANATVEALGALFAAPARQASANYGIGTDGRVACYVEEENRPWTTGSREIDFRAITIEVASDTTHPYVVTNKAYDALIKLVADICERNNIPLDREHVIGHEEYSPKKKDPGELFDWSRIIPETQIPIDRTVA